MDNPPTWGVGWDVADPNAKDLKIETEMIRQVCVVAPVGQIDSYSHTILEERLVALVEDNRKLFVINCAYISYISSAGIGAFITLKKRLGALQGRVAFARMNTGVHEVFERMGLLPIFSVKGTVDEAVALVEKAATG